MGKPIYAIGELHTPLLVDLIARNYEHDKDMDLLVDRIQFAIISGANRIAATLRAIEQKEIEQLFIEGTGVVDALRFGINPEEYDVVMLDETSEDIKKLVSAFRESDVADDNTILQSAMIEYNPKREKLWAQLIDENYVNPSLLLCGSGHLDLSMYGPELGVGRLSELLKDKGYILEILYLEALPKEVKPEEETSS